MFRYHRNRRTKNADVGEHLTIAGAGL